MLEEGFVNYPIVGFQNFGLNASEMKTLLARIEESEVSFLLSYGLNFFEIYIDIVAFLFSFASLF